MLTAFDGGFKRIINAFVVTFFGAYRQRLEQFISYLPAKISTKFGNFIFLALLIIVPFFMFAFVLQQAFGLLGFFTAWMMQKLPRNTDIRMMIALGCLFHTMQYILSGQYAGAVMTIMVLARAILFTAISDDYKIFRKYIAYISIVVGLSLVLFFAYSAEHWMAYLPSISVVFGGFADALTDKKSHLARFFRVIIHGTNLIFNALYAYNIGGALTDMMVIINMLRNAVSQGDFEKGGSVKSYLMALRHDK